MGAARGRACASRDELHRFGRPGEGNMAEIQRAVCKWLHGDMRGAAEKYDQLKKSFTDQITNAGRGRQRWSQEPYALQFLD